MNKFSDEKIIESWGNNVEPWIRAIQEEQIESRKKITNQALVDSILSLEGRSILDIGCGEGWLARSLPSSAYDFSGVDVIPELIAEAKKGKHGEFKVLAYEELTLDKFNNKFDIVVCNFSLLGKESVERIFTIVPSLLNKGGTFLMQTPHPMVSCGDLPYKDGWREGSWLGFNSDFSDPAPWYFRTLASWFKLFKESEFQLEQYIEPLIPDTGQVASLIMAGKGR